MTRSAVRYGYADSPLGQLHYAEAGDGPAVILLHQTPRSHDEFAEILPLLAGSHRAVAMDMYGFGRSAKPEGAQTIEAYARGVIELAAALGIESFTVMGHHTGAEVSVEVAAAVPDRVTAVVLSSPSLTDESYRNRNRASPGVDDAVPAPDGSHLTTIWAQRAPYYPEHGRSELLNRFIRDALAPGLDPLEGHHACARYTMEDRIGLITAPVLIIGADADPFTYPDVRRVAAALSSAASVDVKVVAGGTIPLMETRPEEVAGHVLEFLRRTAPVSQAR